MANGVAGNSRLTAVSGMALLLLCAAEVVTVILGAAHVLTAHVVIGMVLTPIALVKIGSAGWRIVRYYRGDPVVQRYRRREDAECRLRVMRGLRTSVAQAGIPLPWVRDFNLDGDPRLGGLRCPARRANTGSG